MKNLTSLTALVLLVTAPFAQAHTHLKSSLPAEGSIVAEMPAKLSLSFSEAARITALAIQKDGGAMQKLAPLPTAMTADISVPVPALGDGKYTVTWRVVSDDGHIMAGAVHFTVSAASAH